MAGGYRLIDDYFRRTFKPTAAIIQRNGVFFSGLGDVSEVYVLGHGLAQVDAPYFAEILDNLSAEVDWIISYYGKDCERARIEAAAIEIGIPIERTRFALLKDL